MAAEPVFLIAGLNALLNAVSAGVILRARRWITRGNVARHRRLMTTGALLQAVFLVLYTIKTSLYGTTPFAGDPGVRVAYLTLLAAHVGAATLSAPLVLITLFFGLRQQYRRHRALARWTYPLWVFSSLTGPITFLMLYGFGRPGYGIQALGW